MLAGGGLAGIGWETGILRGIADETPETAKALLDVDVLVGTSAGSTVAAQLGSGLGLDVLFDRQTAESSTELSPGVGVAEIIDLFVTAMLTPNTTNASTSSAAPPPNGDGADRPDGTSTTATSQSLARAMLTLLPTPPSM